MLKWDTAWRALRAAAELPASDSTTCGIQSSRSWPHWGWPTTSSSRSAATCRDGCWSTTRTSASTPSARRSTRSMPLGAAPRQPGRGRQQQQSGWRCARRRRNRRPRRGVRRAHVTVSGQSLRLSGSPLAGKLLIPLERRDVRVVEGARLEIHLAVRDGVLSIAISVTGSDV